MRGVRALTQRGTGGSCTAVVAGKICLFEMIINWRRKQTILTNSINFPSCLAALRSLRHALTNSSQSGGWRWVAGGRQSQSSALGLLFRICKSGDYSICWSRLPAGNNAEDETVVWLRHMKHFHITTWVCQLVSMPSQSPTDLQDPSDSGGGPCCCCRPCWPC